jgi:lipopolysaccharide export LptBFGC system permease protein LptF
LSRRLEAGKLDRQVVQRQERLFRRMLDAGRTLQGREEDEKKERLSTTATDDSVHLPPALRARLQGEDQRLRVPTWEELQQLSPEERRLVVDYFRRLSQPFSR